jgi:hypothetical protein
MTRLRGVPLRVGPEHLVRQLFLLLRHRVVEIVEGRDQLLQMPDMCFGYLLIGLHVLHRVHCQVLLSALHESLIHIAGVFAHDLGELIPLRLLGRGNLQLRVQLFDMVLDPSCGCASRSFRWIHREAVPQRPQARAAGQRQSLTSGMSSPYRVMYCLCSISLSRIACLA